MVGINSNEWWEKYFHDEKWRKNGGSEQTYFFAEIMLQYINKQYIEDIKNEEYSICDFGCAYGELTALLNKEMFQCNVCGVDVSRSAIEHARNKFPDIKFEVGNIFENIKKYDVIFCSNVLEHFKNPYETLNKLMEFSRHYIVIMVPYREKELDPSHFYRFSENDLIGRYGCYNVIQRTVIDTQNMPNTYWKGQQLLVVMKKEKINYNALSKGIFAKPEVWDKVSEDYKIEIDDSEEKLADEIYGIFLKSNIKPPAKIIELGCGSGHLSACMAKKGYEVTLLDFSEGALAKAKETFEFYNLKGEFVKGDIFDLSGLNKKYDLVWNSGVMEHFSNENLTKIFQSIMNVTKEKFVFLVPNPNCISYLLMRYNLQGQHKWDYGMEYLRTDYMDIARQVGFGGEIIGYAASSISKWHFYSTFADSENSKIYSDMVDKNLLPEEEAYLIAYEMNKICDVKENKLICGNEDKEKIFELCAENYTLEKEKKTVHDQLILEREKEQLHEEKEQLYKEKERLYEEKEKLQEIIEKLKSENKELYEGSEFNKLEKERVEKLNYEIIALLEPKIKAETLKIEQVLSAPGYCKMSAIHAVLGMFKRASLIAKIKIIAKIMLRFVGIRKDFHTQDIRMDYKIRNGVVNIDNIVGSISKIIERDMGCKEDDIGVKEGERIALPQKEIFYALEPKVSILLPVYNHASYIEEAIEGVKKQTYKNWELIIINDGSTDNLLEILENYKNDSRIKLFTQDNQRLPNTLTNLHNLASGEFVTWTSADNVMEPKMIEVLVENLIRNPQSIMVYADVEIIDADDNYLGYGYREMNRDKQNLYVMRLPHATDALDAECDNFINACFMYRMTAVKALKGQYSADLEGLEDYDFWLRLRAIGNITHVCNEKPLYRYRVHENTMSEDLLKNKQAEHQRRSEKMMEYSLQKDAYCSKNWKFIFESAGEKIQSALESINYNFYKDSEKIVRVVKNDRHETKEIYILEKENDYVVKYSDGNGDDQVRAIINKGITWPVITKKVRQTTISGLYWEYPAKFVNMPVVGCHCDLSNISIEKTITFINKNKDKLFSICAMFGGSNLEAEKAIMDSCENVIFMGEKEKGSCLYLYASWDMMFLPPMDKMTNSYILEQVIGAWNLGKWIMVEQNNLEIKVLPFVCEYAYDETLLGIKHINNIGQVEPILDSYVQFYSEIGVAQRIIKVLNGVAQDIYVQRPDFELIPKERKFPPERIDHQENEIIIPEKLKNGYIAVMVDTLDKGGLEQVVAMLVRELIKKGIQIKVFCTNAGGLIAQKLVEEGVSVLEFKNNTKSFEKYIKENSPILINTHYTHNMLDIVQKVGIPMVDVIHNMYVFLGDEEWKSERIRSKYFDRMIAVSDIVKTSYMEKHGNISEQKIVVIGNCADEQKIYGQSAKFVRDELNIAHDSTVFINVSSIDSRKNQLGLLTAFDMFYKTENKNSYLILVGNCLSEFYNNEVENYMKELDSNKHIIKLDYYQDIADLYNAADVFVMPSYFEGWSIAATEALYSGLPIIHSRCGSAIELIKNGENGILISNPEKDIMSCSKEKLITDMQKRVPENTEELVDAMKKMDCSIDRWREKKGKISSHALADFSKTKMIDKYIECFSDSLFIER